jgi:hypothetical protein
MHNDDMLNTDQTIKAAEFTNGDKVTFMWKDINIKIKDEIKGDSHFEFNPSHKIKEIGDMLKDNSKLAFDDYELKLDDRVLENDKVIMNSGIKDNTEISVNYAKFGIKVKLPGQD